MHPESRQRRPLWFRLARGLFFTVLTLATLVALLWAFENWRGERQWQTLVKAYATRGDPLDASGLTPATVPDDQNVAMTPLLRPLTEYDIVKGEPVWHDAPGIARLDALKLPPLQRDGRSEDGRISLSEWQSAFRATNTFPLPATPGSPAADVLAALNRWKPELDELESATRRPHTRFNRSNTQDSVHALLPQLARGKALSQILKLRCVARLAAGDGDGALSDIEFNERWARALASDPLLISQLVAIAIETLGTAMAWEGLADHRWNDAQLQRLQALFAARTPREDMKRAMRGERAFGLAIMDRWVRDPAAMETDGIQSFKSEDPYSPGRTLPRGWVRQNQISLVRFHELMAERSDRWIQGGQPGHELGGDVVEQLKQERPWFYNQLTLMLAPALGKAMSKEDRVLTISRMAEIVCALERYRLVHETYPDSLDALVPALLQALPPDPCTGAAFRYRRVADGSFRLYSLGPNQRDDHGVFVPDDAKADWLWPVPTETSKRMF